MADELTFKDEQELLDHPAVVKYVDEKVSEAEQDAYDKINKVQDMVVKQIISLGVATDSYYARELKQAVEKGEEEAITQAHDALAHKLNERSIESLCDTLADVNDEYFRSLKSQDSVDAKLEQAMDRQPADQTPTDQQTGTDDTDNDNDDDKDNKPADDGNDEDKSNDNTEPADDSKEDLNNPDGGDSQDEPQDQKTNKDENPFDRVFR